MLTPAEPGIAKTMHSSQIRRVFICNKTMNNIPSHHFFVKSLLIFQHLVSLQTFPVVRFVQYCIQWIDTFPQRTDTHMTNVLFYRKVMIFSRFSTADRCVPGIWQLPVISHCVVPYFSRFGSRGLRFTRATPCRVRQRMRDSNLLCSVN